MPATIKFYHQDRSYGEFSNFYPRSIYIEGLLWPCTESFFQGMKSQDPDVIERMRALKTPGEAKKLGGKILLRPDWEHGVGGLPKETMEVNTDDPGLVVHKVKDFFMYQALVAKFTQHPDLGQVLLGTGDALLVEDTQSVGRDPYWGNGPDGNGENKLGRMLMLVRKALPRHLLPPS